MSDLMILGVLRMPVTPRDDYMTLAQYIDRGHQAADLIEQQQQRIAELEDKRIRELNKTESELQGAFSRIDELSATVERLREIFLEGFESGGDHDLDAWEEKAKAVLAATPQQNLNSVRRQELENFQQWALGFVCSPEFDPLKRKVFRKLNSGAQGQQVMPHNDTEYCGLLALFSEYADTKYPSGNQCSHQWVNAENKVVKNGYVCVKCHAVCSDIKYPIGKE